MSGPVRGPGAQPAGHTLQPLTLTDEGFWRWACACGQAGSAPSQYTAKQDHRAHKKTIADAIADTRAEPRNEPRH